MSGQAIINLFDSKDPSTLIHEFTRHFYLETLLRAEAMNEITEIEAKPKPLYLHILQNS